MKDPGYASPSNDNGGGGNFAYSDQETGTDYSTEIAALANGTIYFKVGSNPWTSGATGSVTLNTSQSLRKTALIGCSPLRAEMISATVGDMVYLSNQPNGEIGGYPADGQVLTWVAANSQWEPGDFISKATLKAEVAASADFADFQSRIAAL